ncbi:hypothetical protein P3L10_033796 [Capsicum annuum]
MPTFPYKGIVGVSVFLPKNWCIHDSFLGFAVCCNGELTDVTAHLIPLSDDGMSCITRKLAFSKYLGYYGKIMINIVLGQGGVDLMIVNTMMKPVAPDSFFFPLLRSSLMGDLHIVSEFLVADEYFNAISFVIIFFAN